MTTTKRTFTKEFREQAVKMVLEDGLAQTEVARRLGVGHSVIFNWVQAVKTEGAEALRGKGNLKPQDAEIKWMQQEIRELNQENDFLKKSALYFASLKK